MKSFVMPIIIGVTGILTKGLKNISKEKSSCTRDISHSKESATV
jgi:hypothetical protein